MTYWYLFCKGDLLLAESGGRYAVPCGEEAPVRLEPWHTQIVLPELDGCPCRAARLDGPVVKPGYCMMGLRDTFDVLPSSSYNMAGKAHELLYWDTCTKFCGVCGAPMKFHTDISKRCTNCGKEVWPQVAPAVIVAVTRGDEILLTQSRNFRGDYYGLVAGFVETGETVEEALRREVMEETGICVENIRYVASQPWPYPSGLMLGFTADYAGGELHIQRSELTKGGWFHRDHLPPIPGKVSLARTLIDRWLGLAENAGG